MKALVLKTSEVQASVGSNPTHSATIKGSEPSREISKALFLYIDQKYYSKLEQGIETTKNRNFILLPQAS